MKKNKAIKINAQQLLDELLNLNLENAIGRINFNMAGINIIINQTDIVGNSLQAWLGEYLKHKNYYFRTPDNTQAFPDFYLSEKNNEGLLEVKSFNFDATPGFDIANFESYVESVKQQPYKLEANYLIFGYSMSKEGDISVPKIWLKKIWEISGTSTKWPLKVQDKRGMIYNIRPSSNFKRDIASPFKNKIDFLEAIYKTLIKYKNIEYANSWLDELKENYLLYYKEELNIEKVTL